MKESFIVEKPVKHCPSQVIKEDSGGVSCGQSEPLM